jgi:hypothetical protein
MVERAERSLRLRWVRVTTPQGWGERGGESPLPRVCGS